MSFTNDSDSDFEFDQQQQQQQQLDISSEVESFSRIAKFKWIIKNFSTLVANERNALSPRITVPFGDQKVTLFLQLLPTDTKRIPRLQIQLNAKSSHRKISFTAKFWLIEISRDHDKSTNHPFNVSNQWSSVKYTLIRNDIFKDAARYLHCDSLWIGCSLYEMEYVRKEQYVSIPSDAAILASDLGRVLTLNGQFADVEVAVVKECKTFKAHKIVLAARSEVFAAMLDSKHDFAECSRNQIEIDDFDSETIEELLKYIYSAKVTCNSKIDLDLLVAADKYSINSLKTRCEEYLSQRLEVDTVSRSLAIADMHSATQLKSNCIDFIYTHTQLVFASTEWTELLAKQPQLANQVKLEIHRRDEDENRQIRIKRLRLSDCCYSRGSAYRIRRLE